ncbi:FkbM family methyltransferase [Thioalkalivibrio sp. ALE19]|uniref:FkbM family methyltransferase n=1 Tax=Thioalkalivibrio sp. ALE19 TaxID=1266909 RepID=UPI0009DBE84E|nr:FkbM family methyltransferase [Thioalkalivibrio sp. ALE19]
MNNLLKPLYQAAKKTRYYIHSSSLSPENKIFIDRLMVSPKSFLGKGRDVCFVFDGDEDLLLVYDDEYCLWFYETSRALRYFNGVSKSFDVLKKRYFPRELLLSEVSGSTVIDVGANVGEFSFLCESLGASRVIAFEPDPIAYKCLSRNSNRIGGVVSPYNVLLHEKEKEVNFFLSPKSADSSFIEPDSYDKVEKVQAVTLNQYASKIGNDRLLIKVEAEGGEPEVLKGSREILKRGNVFLTVRASFERQGESTMPECKKILHDAGYRYFISEDGKQLLGWSPELRSPLA